MITLIIHQMTNDEKETLSLSESKLRHQPLIIGRLPGCDILLADASVSRKHAQLSLEQNKLVITDLQSSGGTVYSGKSLAPHRAQIIAEGDEILIGPFNLKVQYPASDEANTRVASDNYATQLTTPKKKHFQPVALVKPDEWLYWDGGVIDVTCSKIFHETHDVKTFIFTAKPNILFRYKPGQFATLHLIIDGKKIARSYTISSTPSRPHTLSVTVKRVPATEPHPPGLVSNWLHENMTVGQPIQISGPFGDFTCHSHPAAKLCFISGGSGVTPMLSMTRWLCDTAAEVDIVFFHLAKTPEDIVAQDELNMLAARHANLHLIFSVTRDNSPGHWSGFRGRISPELLSLAIPDLHDRLVFVCGPQAFMAHTQDVLRNGGFPMKHYHEESFGGPSLSPPAHNPQDTEEPAPKFGLKALLNAVSGQRSHSTEPSGEKPAKAKAREIHFKKSGVKAPCSGGSILDTAEQQGLTLAYGCRQGLCGACKQKLIKGDILREGYNDGVLNTQDKSAGFILTCIAKPTGDIELDA